MENILAEGEVTGHAHRAIGERVEVIDRQLLNAPEGATIVHEEHEHIEIPMGEYDILRVVEYDHWKEEARIVQD